VRHTTASNAREMAEFHATIWGPATPNPSATV